MPRTPDYVRIAEEVKEKIWAGSLGMGDRLPSISQLQKQYGVSAQPVKSALLVLQTEGLTEGQQGRGVFITEKAAKEAEARRAEARRAAEAKKKE